MSNVDQTKSTFLYVTRRILSHPHVQEDLHLPQFGMAGNGFNFESIEIAGEEPIAEGSQLATDKGQIGRDYGACREGDRS